LEVVVAMLASMATCPLSTLASWPCHGDVFPLRIVYGDSALIAIGFSGESGEVSMKIAIMATGGVIARGQHLRWPRSFEQNFRVTKWIVGRG
jgi:hypothetical protein